VHATRKYPRTTRLKAKDHDTSQMLLESLKGLNFSYDHSIKVALRPSPDCPGIASVVHQPIQKLVAWKGRVARFCCCAQMVPAPQIYQNP